MESATIAQIHFTPTAPRRTAAITAQYYIVGALSRWEWCFQSTCTCLPLVVSSRFEWAPATGFLTARRRASRPMI